MEVTIEQTTPCSRSVAIEVPRQTVEACFQRIIKKVAKEAQLPGFRKGHVPAQLVAKQFGEYIASEVSQTLVQESLQEVSSQHQLQVVNSPKVVIHKLERGEPMSFTADMEVMPTLERVDYQQLPIAPAPSPISEEQVAQALRDLARQHSTIEPVNERTMVQAQDLVMLDCRGTLEGEPTSYGEESNNLVDTDATHAVAPLPEFLLGKQVPGTYELVWQVPKDFVDEDLAGQTLTYQVVLHDIKHRQLPVMDEEFARDQGHETLAALQQATLEQLEQEQQSKYKKEREEQLWAALLARNPFEVPPSLVQQTSQQMVQNMLRYLNNTTLSSEQLQHFYESAQPGAISQVRTALLMRYLITEEKIEVSDEEVQARIAQLISERSDAKWRSNVLAYYEDQDRLDQLKQSLLHDKVTALLFKHSVVRQDSSESEQISPAG